MTRRGLYLRLLSLWGTLLPCSFFVLAAILISLAYAPPAELLRNPFFIGICGTFILAQICALLLTLRWIDEYARTVRLR